jgi:C4-type Zn-finger protein
MNTNTYSIIDLGRCPECGAALRFDRDADNIPTTPLLLDVALVCPDCAAAALLCITAKKAVGDVG